MWHACSASSEITCLPRALESKRKGKHLSRKTPTSSDVQVSHRCSCAWDLLFTWVVVSIPLSNFCSCFFVMRIFILLARGVCEYWVLGVFKLLYKYCTNCFTIPRRYRGWIGILADISCQTWTTNTHECMQFLIILPVRWNVMACGTWITDAKSRWNPTRLYR